MDRSFFFNQTNKNLSYFPTIYDRLYVRTDLSIKLSFRKTTPYVRIPNNTEKNISLLYSLYYAEACNEWWGPFQRFSSYSLDLFVRNRKHDEHKTIIKIKHKKGQGDCEVTIGSSSQVATL